MFPVLITETLFNGLEKMKKLFVMRVIYLKFLNILYFISENGVIQVTSSKRRKQILKPTGEMTENGI